MARTRRPPPAPWTNLFTAPFTALGIALLAGAAVPGAAAAQVEDPIGALLDNPPAAAPVTPPPPAASAPVITAPPTTPAPAASPTPAAVTPPPPTPTPPPASPSRAPVRADRDRPTIASQPVFLDAPDPLGAPLSAEERSYEARLRASFDSAQGLQGPLDGGWALAAAGGGDLYALRFVDRGAGALEAAWRDLRRPGALDGSGFVDSVERIGGRVTLRFTPRRGAPPTVITLTAAGEGQWTGDLIEDGAPRGVVLRRR